MIIRNFNTEDWITPNSASKLRGVTRQSIYYSITMGKLTALELDKTIFVSRSEVEKLKIRAPNKSSGDDNSFEKEVSLADIFTE
jgi:hypothetical protein